MAKSSKRKRGKQPERDGHESEENEALQLAAAASSEQVSELAGVQTFPRQCLRRWRRACDLASGVEGGPAERGRCVGDGCAAMPEKLFKR